MTDQSKINHHDLECIEAHVKWYNPEKGYGFLNREGSSEDIMIHFSALDKVGCPYVKVGDHVICEIAFGKRGLYVVHIIEIKLGDLEPRTLQGFYDSRLMPFDPESLEEIEGVIKWYNPDKGYGFIIPDKGGSEIFLYYPILRAAGYRFLAPGTRVLAKVSTSERSQEARFLMVLLEEEDKWQEAG